VKLTLDLRPRCKRRACQKLITKGKMAQDNYKRYAPFCSFGCKEWDRLEEAQRYLNERRFVAKEQP
jgi:hypothetical protein